MPDVRVYRMTENGAPACLATVRDGELCSDDPDDLEAHSLPSVAQEALRTKRPVLTPPSGESTAADDASAAGLASAGQTMAVVPLLARDRVVGLVEATETRRGRTITPEQLANAESVCRLVALSIQDAEYFTAKELQADRLASLLVASQAVTSAATLEEALTIVARCAGNVLGVSHCIAYEYQEDRAAIVARASWEKTPSGWSRVGEALPLADHPAEASILASNQPLLESLSDPRLDPKSRAVMEEWSEKTCLTVPMRSVDGANGLLVFFDNERERSFPAEEMALATCLAELAGEAVRGAQLLRRLQLLSETDSLTGLANHRSLHATLERELAQAARHGSQFSVIVLDIDGFKLFNDTYGHPVGDVILRQVADLLRENTRRGDLVGRSGGDEFMIVLPGTSRSGAGALVKKLRSTLSCMPYVTAEGERIPVRASFGVAAYPQDGGDVNELLVSSDANLYVSKRRGGDAVTGAGEEQEDLALASEEDGFGFLESLVAAVDNKDRYTRHHSDEVTIYALALARTLGLSESSQRIVRVAGLLHDVGKIGIPDRILSKPGRLTSEAYAVIKRHPALGEKLIAAVPDLDEIRAAVASHHERYDGKGYPMGLAHQEIPLIGRILAVADAYSAMTTDRPYRQGLTYEEAVSELKAGSGTQFDPEIVAAFLQYLDGQPRPDADDRTVILGSSHTGP